MSKEKRRNRPGGFLENLLNERIIFEIIATAYAVSGSLLGGFFSLWAWSDSEWPQWGKILLVSFVVGSTVFIVSFFGRGVYRRWSMGGIRKGRDAEVKLGDKLDYAVTDSHCAVAHDIDLEKLDLGSGNIDHLVLTPKRLWLIETKSSMAPMNKVLKRVKKLLNKNTSIIKEHLHLGDFPVKCALAFPADHFQEDIEKDGIYCVRYDLLIQEIKEEVRKASQSEFTDEHRDRVEKIWKMGTYEFL